MTDWDKQKASTQHWSGVVFYPEKNAHWHNEEHEAAQKQTLQKNIFAAIGICIGLALFVYTAYNATSLALLVFGFCSLLGLIIAVFLLGAELGFQNNLVKQVCGAVSNGGCEKVLNSKQAKSFLGFTPADLGLIYFTTQFLIFLAAPLLIGLEQILYTAAFAGLLVAAWSIYTQAFVLKEYCALCLGLVAVLLLQFALAGFNFNASNFVLMQLLAAATLFIIIAAILFPIKNLLNQNKKNSFKAKELVRWKTDANIYNALLNQEQEVDNSIWDNDLILGNPNAPILITVACNPYCGPCAKAHTLLDEILDQFPNKVAVQIRLACNPVDLSDARTQATAAILQNAVSLNNGKDLQTMLTDWFHMMDLPKWSAKWQAKNENDVQEVLDAHNNWNQQSNIRFTPSFFMNGKAMPTKYSIDDVQKILPDLLLLHDEKILQ